MLVVGQSGSGKSFFVTRLIEEIILNTKARVVVVDPNGDFRSISAIAPDWKAIAQRLTEKGGSSPRSPDFDDQQIFRTAWLQRRFLHLYPNTIRLPTDSDMVLHRKLVLHWASFDEEDRDFLLRCMGELSPRTLLGLEACVMQTHYYAERPNSRYGDDLRGMEHAAEQFAERHVPMVRYAYARDLAPDDWYAVRAKVMDLLRQYTIWWSKSTDTASSVRPYGLSDYLDGPFLSHDWGSEAAWDLMTIGLDAARASDALLVVNATLSRLWKNAKEAWRVTTRHAQGSADTRVPTFIVIDEAQNFAPEYATDPLRKRVTSQLIQIAAEGRKYGIYLILATQRPTKLHPALVPECENSCVLRVQSALDIKFASDALGIDPKLVGMAPTFHRGQGLVSGRWIANDVALDTRFLPARTLVSGGGLPRDWQHRTQPSEPFVIKPRRVEIVVLSELEASDSPVALVELAEVVRTKLPDLDDGSWGGHGTFKGLIVNLGIPDLAISSVGPGYAYLNGVHSPPTEREVAAAFSVPVELEGAIAEMRQQSSAPLLEPSACKRVFEILSEEVQERPFNITDTSKAIRDALVVERKPVGRMAISFILKGIHHGGHRYDPDLPQDPKSLAAAYVRNLRSMVNPRPPLEGNDLHAALSFSCGGLLSADDVALLLGGGPPRTEGAGGPVNTMDE